MPLRDFLIDAAPRHFWWVLVLSMAAAVGCFYLFLRWLNRARLMADTPTAAIRSAAQGYVELEGIARLMDGDPVVSPLSGERCVWYRYTVEHRDEDERRWRTVASGLSDSIFHLDDGTGRCIVDPEGATILPSVRLSWRGQLSWPGAAPLDTSFWDRYLQSGPYRYTEHRLQEGDPLYATGQFVALGGTGEASPSEAVRDLLSCWKRDRRELLRRFDADRDGEISPEEWEMARQEAEREVRVSWHQRTRTSELSLLRKPGNGRPYLLSALPQHTLIARYRRQALLAAGGFLGFGAFAVWALRLRFGGHF